MKKWNRQWRFFSFGENEEADMTNLVERLLFDFKLLIDLKMISVIRRKT